MNCLHRHDYYDDVQKQAEQIFARVLTQTVIRIWGTGRRAPKGSIKSSSVQKSFTGLCVSDMERMASYAQLMGRMDRCSCGDAIGFVTKFINGVGYGKIPQDDHRNGHCMVGRSRAGHGRTKHMLRAVVLTVATTMGGHGMAWHGMAWHGMAWR